MGNIIEVFFTSGIATVAVAGLWLLAIAFSSTVTSWLIVLFFLLNQGIMQYMEFPGLISRGMPEALVLALVIKAILPRLATGKSVRFLGAVPVFGFIVCVGLSALTAGVAGVEALMFVRHSMVFYLLFLAALNMDMTARNFRVIGSFLCLMALMQLPIGLGKFLTFGFWKAALLGPFQ